MSNKTTEKAKTEKSYMLSTELFKDRKDIPDFITNHRVFSNPFKISKIFPSIGLKNFEEPCEIARPLVDLKKDNFITPLINVIYNNLTLARDAAIFAGDKINFILAGSASEQDLQKCDKYYNLGHVLRGLIEQIDVPNNKYEAIVKHSAGKVALKLSADVQDSAGTVVFRNEEALFKVLNKVKTLCTDAGIEFFDHNQCQEFKTFSAENVANKVYKVVFSSDGKEGAYDILTMSMRGIKSCQRWDGDYPRCLIGSIISKYVGIIYITSGSEIPFKCVMPSGQELEGKGTKMMRRALVRYAIDIDEQQPCLLIERLYPTGAAPEIENETLKVFKQVLSAKTKLPIHHAPSLGNKIRHFYIPYEKIREEVSERDWTYQDSPLKTAVDLQISELISSSSEDATRYINAFKANIIVQMSEYARELLSNRKQADVEIVRTFSNMRTNNRLDSFIESFSKTVFDRNNIYVPGGASEPKEYFRKYLIQLALNLKNIKRSQHNNIVALITSSTSREVNHTLFINFLFDNMIKNIVAKEVRSLIQ